MSRSNKEFVGIRYSVDVYINYAVEDNNIFMLSYHTFQVQGDERKKP